MFTVAEIMTTQLYTVTVDATLAQARDLMSEHNIRHLPVVDNGGGLLGLVTQRDVLAVMDSDLYRIDESQSSEREDWIRVRDFMTKEVATIDERADACSAARHLERHKYGCLPVVTEGALSGIVTETDFVGLAINLLQLLEAREPTQVDE